MPETPNLPEVLVSQVNAALANDNPRQRNAAMKQIISELNSEIQGMRADYGRLIREVERFDRAARDAEAMERRHSAALETAIRQRDEEGALRQEMARANVAADAEHSRSMVQIYHQQARLQQERQDELSGLREELRRTYQELESEAIGTLLNQRYLEHLKTYQQASQRLEEARRGIRSMQADTVGRGAQQLADPVLDSKLRQQKSKRLAAEEMIRRRMSNGE